MRKERSEVADFLSDDEIIRLVKEQKRVPSDFMRRSVPKPKRGHAEVGFDVKGETGSEFRIIIRRSRINPLDFSIILGYRMPKSNQVLRLRRYNGRSHEHTNPLEEQTFYDFHIHMATEKYQLTGNREDTFAEVTDRYSSLDEAILCLVEDCNVIMQDNDEQQMDFFNS